ncbi:AAA family ATPase [Nitrosopumilus sp.]|uniref:AAA family ATPase n=1 Tax=Nitrosopumilus sp. TaxID=2024843 RepID=UPI00247B3343|nr:AAA family ATPase [Nitrosopumilus sp.]MCV0411258.1 ATP-binding protein [Nitrosopumilus sp.]
MYLEKIRLENFKSHVNWEIPLSQFNILIGSNSSGKSSILQALLILKTSLKQQGTNNLTYSTDSYDYGNFKDVVSFGDLTRKIRIGVEGIKTIATGIDYEGKTKADFGYYVTEGEKGISDVYLGVNVDHYDFEFSYRNQKTRINSRRGQEEKSTLECSINGLHPRIASKEGSETSTRINNIFANGEFTEQLLDEFFYIPFFRSATKYGVKLVRTPDDLLSSSPESLMDVTLSKLSKDTDLLGKISSFIHQLTGKTIRTRNVDLLSSELQGVTLEFVKNGFANAIANEGTGPNQVILLLTILVGSPSGSVIAIDEPEIHLHPKAQSKLVELMIEISNKDNKQLIFTTHSEHMLYPFLAKIASKQQINPTRVTVNSFYQDEKTGVSKIETLPINEHGQIKNGLKEFWETDFEMFSKYVGEPND